MRLMALIFAALWSGGALADGVCSGEWANPVTDICWSCAAPIKLFGSTEVLSMDQEDTPNPSTAFCVCGDGMNFEAGIQVSFWEPVRQVDVTRVPYCMVGMGGMQLDIGFGSDAWGVQDSHRAEATTTSFYHSHYYINPIVYLLEVLLDSNCTEHMEFDIPYMSEMDPTYGDEELENLLTPDAFLFGSLAAAGAQAADCVASTAGFGIKELFWVTGCNGWMYPFTGDVQAHYGAVQASSVVVPRVTAKMHRLNEFWSWSTSGEDGMCGKYPQLIMDKTDYKYSMTYPVPQTQKIAGKCCQPFGRTTALWGSGKEFPYKGEDFNYILFRKRNCCQGAVGTGSFN